MTYIKNITPKQIKFLESVINDVKGKQRPIRAEVIPCKVPAWGTTEREKGDYK
tara:strand:- start:544 stop:702 length:159 start_codon:yes stop_codon:yes gene_type:complete